MSSGVTGTRIGSVLEIVVSRPHERNALRPNTLAALGKVLNDAEADASVSGVILRASGETFLYGGIFTDETSDDSEPLHVSAIYKPAIGSVFEAWRRRTFPVIAVVNGPALAFGCALALTADVTIASPAATFTLPELDNGLVPVYAIALMATRYDMNAIRDLVLTRHSLSAVDAATRGMVNELAASTTVAETIVDAHVHLWNRLGRNVTKQAMQTFEALDRADLLDSRRIADEGLELLFDRFRSKQSTQDYLERF
ncbi:enoyl-CoA hydratase/isomerase family protein [Rhodococcoides fascians A25f]|uniref:enoyl-CoA hydratase/isomerase family protein n=1 Tax=Rhodococcoides fascians TaxID=1828 RepID=UPI00055E0603|nr:enoyl-CoA hydratase/isomerase family protein [Rhodococcus fascians]QII07287.1 enoyl-CoA hydratase/isomerase family protein [Rhodococcus fascians A25f]